MNNQTLFGLKNFISNSSSNSIKIKSIEKAKKYQDQTGGSYLNSEGAEVNFISENYISKSQIPDAGYGVYANRDYKEGDVVEINTFLEYVDNRSGLENYVFKSHMNDNKHLIVLGNGSIFNHHDNNNINYYYMPGKRFFVYKANRDIKKGEEMYINYGANWFINRQKNDS